MASPAQCKAEPGNANLSTEAKTEERNSQSAKYTVRDDLFAAYERLAPSHSGRMQWTLKRCTPASLNSAPRSKTTFDSSPSPNGVENSTTKWKRLSSPPQSRMRFETSNPPPSKMNLAARRCLAVRSAATPKVSTSSQNSRALNRSTASSQKGVQPLPGPPEPAAQTPRNGPCPCGFGEKFKRCCGVGSPAVLGAALGDIPAPDTPLLP